MSAPRPAERGTDARPAERRVLVVRGRVQGVGFRPFVHRAAAELGLAGAAWNEGGDVVVDAEGDPRALDELVRRVRAEPPRPARVEAVEEARAALLGRAGFALRASAPAPPGAGGPTPRVAPDAATCAACLAEVRDPADRRHAHPFATCTDCGPRYSIARGLPFDRPRTTMAAFAPCAACAREHDDPASRRFHAQTNACPACGPRLRCEPAADDPLAAALRTLGGGGIVALKGLGGFHLACDARSEAAVRRLRARKHRPAKPLAVLLADLAAVAREAELGPDERDTLASPRAPIVLLRRRSGGTLAPSVAPGLAEVGCLLPSTPLHHMLAERFGGPLVLTSGNASGEPVCATDEEARAALGRVADLLLTHDRAIESRVDDSLVRVVRDRERVLRRARGYVPEVLPLPLDAPPLVAIGGDLKSAPCLARGRDAVLGQHVGDLESRAASRLHGEVRAHLEALLDVRPRLVAHDLHPGYHGTRLALALARRHGVPAVAVQHHHAHVAACLVEHGRVGPALGVALDGIGFGADGTPWGGEVLVADLARATRVARLRPVPLPGGDVAALEPWRMALSWLLEAGLPEHPVDGPSPVALELVREMITKRVHSPPTSSAGRLFDAVAALAGVRAEVSWEGQAAAELEALSEPGAAPYPLPLESSGELLELDARPLVRAVAADAARDAGPGEIGSRFHAALAAGVVAACRAARERAGLDVVALTGGCFQNRLLLELAADGLAAAGFEVLLHARVPPNDGGLALGQAAVAAARAAAG